MRIIRSLLVGFVAILLVASVFGTVIGNGVSVEDESFSGESVAGEDAEEIEDWHDLDAVRDDLDGDYVLMNDLDEDSDGYDELVDTEDGWEPIGDDDNEFTGTFDGDEYEVIDLYINRPNTHYIGLFGYVDDVGEVRNVSGVDADVSGEERVGGLVGYVDDGGEVHNVSVVDADVSGYRSVGGLVGYNSGTVENSSVTGDVSGDRRVGGLVGWNHGTVENSYATGNVSGDEGIGGLVGTNGYISPVGTVSNSYATGNVSGDRFVGGLVGRNWYSTVSNSYATGDVSGDSEVGGLVGKSRYAESTVTNSYATGDVSGEELVGGLVGYNSGTVSNTNATGNVSGYKHVGGLVGMSIYVESTVTNSYFTGDVSGDEGIGGLVGRNRYGTVSNSHYNIDTVEINGGHHVTIGGLFDEQYQDWIEDKNLDIEDYNDTLVPSGDYYEIDSTDGLRDLLGFSGREEYKFRLVSDIDLSDEPGLYIPYLAAEFEGQDHIIPDMHINMSFADSVGMFGYVTSSGEVQNVGMIDADVSGYAAVGGLVGYNYRGTVENSYATGTVSGDAIIDGLMGDFVGGLVGYNYKGTIENSYVTGTVSGYGGVGGLIGRNRGIVLTSYSTSDVSGNLSVGGLVGMNWDGTVSNSYATGDVSGDEYVGGLVGNNWEGPIENSFWDIETSGQDTSDGGTGKTTLEMTKEETFTEAGWDFEEDWDIIEGETYPFLQWQEEDTYPCAPELEEYELTINIEGEGSTEPEEGTHTYYEGEEVTVEATAAEGWYFEEWTGDVPEGEDGEEITITMDENKSLTAHFEELDEYDLKIDIEGEGSTAPEEGTHTYYDGEEVTVEATAEEGWHFDEWTGDVPEGEEGEEITIIMDGNREITAVFEEEVDEEEEDEIPGFTPTLLLLATVIAVAIYKKKKR